MIYLIYTYYVNYLIQVICSWKAWYWKGNGLDFGVLINQIWKPISWTQNSVWNTDRNIKPHSELFIIFIVIWLWSRLGQFEGAEKLDFFSSTKKRISELIWFWRRTLHYPTYHLIVYYKNNHLDVEYLHIGPAWIWR